MEQGVRVAALDPLIKELSSLEGENRIDAINEVKQALHAISPFKNEPVDCALWVRNDSVEANDYNPNRVAPPEMDLLERSILADGYTQPIVASDNGTCFEIVDGFHRSRVGKESSRVRERVGGYLPITLINKDRNGRADRMAATIRHNRARGKHMVDGMSNLVAELSKRNWSDGRIARELGMEPDEVLRLKQITGLAELFSERDFSEAWEDR